MNIADKMVKYEQLKEKILKLNTMISIAENDKGTLNISECNIVLFSLDDIAEMKEDVTATSICNEAFKKVLSEDTYYLKRVVHELAMTLSELTRDIVSNVDALRNKLRDEGLDFVLNVEENLKPFPENDGDGSL